MDTSSNQRRTGSSAGGVRTGATARRETERAAETLLDDLHADTASFTFLFFGSAHDARTVSAILDRRVGPAGVGATTAGEISPMGFTRDAMVGISLHGSDVRASAEVIPNLEELSLVPITKLPEQLAKRIDRSPDELSEDRHVWITLVDGSSGSEDLLTPFIKKVVPSTHLVGGSIGSTPGEGEAPRPELVYHGRVYREAAALILLEYDRPFEVLHHNHLEFLDPTLEVTGIADKGRIIEELDGRPALDAYADALGVPADELNFEFAARYPLGYRFRGRPLACSIVELLDRGRLRLANSVQPGEQLRLLSGDDLVASTREALADACSQFEAEHGSEATAALFFHCAGRFLEADSLNCIDELGEALNQLPFVGFNSLGEQFNALHTNHTLTGLLFG